MYKEINAKNKNIFLHVFIMVISGLILLLLPNYISMGKLTTWYEIMITVMTISLVFWTLKKKNIAFKYQIMSDEMIIKKVYVKHEEMLLSIDFDNIICFNKCSGEDIKNYKCKEASRFCTEFGSSADYVVVYKDKGEVKKFTFEPSSELVELIRQRIS